MYYIFRIVWSQTDNDTVIVRAASQEHAQAYVDNRYANAAYVESRGSTDKLLEA